MLPLRALADAITSSAAPYVVRFLKGCNLTYHAASLSSGCPPSFPWLIKIVGNWPELQIWELERRAHLISFSWTTHRPQ